jgi:hypothetical protein
LRATGLIREGRVLTEEEAEAKLQAPKQVQLSRIIRSNLTLGDSYESNGTHDDINSASGRKLPLQRMELYQMIPRTLLDTWNQESGRTMFTDEELPWQSNC